MKRKLIASLIAACMAVAACFALAACMPAEEKGAKSYVSLDINPSVELTLDANNKVLSVYGANEDGQVLLYGEESLVGLKVEDAVEKITKLAVELGYLDEDNTVVQTNVVGNSKADAILSKINAKVTATAESMDLTVSCQGAEAYSLLRKLDNLKKQYPNNAAIQSLTPAKLKLVVSASETGEVTVEAAAEMDTSKLIETVSKAHEATEAYATEAYNKAKTVANAVYMQAQSAALDSVYTTYLLMNKPLEAYYGFAYQGYKSGAALMHAVADALVYAEKAADYPLNEEQISAISQALGLGDNVDQLKNSKGEITVKSIEAYADKAFKNSELSAELEQIKAKLTAALNSTEQAVQSKIDEINAQYKEEIEAVKTMLEESVAQIEKLIPDSFKQQLSYMTADMKALVNSLTSILADGKITAAEVKAVAEQMEVKAEDTRKTIESKLTDEEKQELASLLEKAEKTLTAEKEKLDQALAKAEQEAKQYLKQLKDQRSVQS